jgi:hypothetical protein
MLAPRKTLWSTPPEVIEVAINALKISSDDIGVYTNNQWFN